MIRTPAHHQSAPLATHELAAAMVRLEDDLIAIPRAERTARDMFLFDVRMSYLRNVATVRAREEGAQRRAANLEFQASPEMLAAFARGG